MRKPDNKCAARFEACLRAAFPQKEGISPSIFSFFASFLLLFALFVPGLGAQTGFFWEQPAAFSAEQGNFPVTAYNDDFGIVVWQEPTRQSGGGQSGGSINIALSVKTPGEPWENRGTIGGPYQYAGTEPSILSALIDERGRIFVAAAASASQTEILVSEDRGRTFERYRMESGTETSLAPRIALASDGTYLLFVTRGSEASLSIYYSRSADGRVWEPFRPFVTEADMQLNFLPSHASLDGREYVVFQSFTRSPDTIPTFQLFVKSSGDGGRTWGPSRRFTSFRDTFTNTAASPDAFDNQRPHLSVEDGSLFVVWERRFRTNSPQVYAARLGSDGVISGIAEQVNSSGSYCNNPVAFSYRGETSVLWFDNRRGGNRVYMAQRSGVRWEETELSGTAGGEAIFGRPLLDGRDLYIFWQTASRQGSTRIYYLTPDTTVNPVQISAGNFTAGSRNRGDRVQVSWGVPSDSSGIEGFSYVFSQEENAAPEKIVGVYNTANRTQSAELAAREDGIWYFTVIARDYAGNWSSPSVVEYIRDTTPPPAATIVPPELDGDGYLLSNTFEISWNPPPASDIEGYVYNLEYLDTAGAFSGLGSEEFNAALESRYPQAGSGNAAPQMRGNGTSASYTNQDDGVWRFTVRAVDQAGNIGPASAAFFRTNKYIPHTYITYVDAVQDEQGILNIGITGRGFSQGGNVARVFLDADGLPPYEREFLLERGEFSVVSDREIRGLTMENLEEGFYRIGVEHPLRGIVFAAPRVSVDETGTVKFGDYSGEWKPSWSIRSERRFSFNTGNLILVSVFILCGLGLLVSVRGIGETIAEGAAIRLDAAALITGDLMPAERKKRMVKIKRRGIGLRFKLAAFTIALVMAVVVTVSLPLYMMMTRARRETLIRGLWDRSTVLLEGIASGVQAYLPMRNVLELGLLPGQMASVPEARYVTITGYNPETSVYDDQVWATNDPAILEKIDTVEFEAGVSRINDVLSVRARGMAAELNDKAREEMGSVSESIGSLFREGQDLARFNDEASARRVADIQTQLRTLQTRVSEYLYGLGKTINSEPEFSLENFVISPDRRYVFFKPVMYRQGSDDVFFRGLVRLEVSIDTILEEIGEEQKTIIRVILLVALAALAAGIIGALVVSALIIRPIQKLVRHVEIIRDTEDKAKLEGVDINLKSKDELAILGNTINDMTHGLVKAAAAAADLSIGKEIQKKFIPLELDREGNKLSYGAKDTKYLDFFGYYEGAKGVSGDYFDYQDLDGRYYAIIKCDVAGKGIPAALIMIQVATMFLGYFRRWKPNEKGMHIEDLVYQINDFIETLGFKGRFAAFTLCLYDAQTGTVRFCNAGDNIVHIFDASEGRVKILSLPATPATGVLPNFLVESKGGYTVQTVKLDPGDILLLYTDGIEEAKRKFRNAQFKEIICEEGEKDTPHATHTVGQGDEEMGPERVDAIVNAVMNRQVYTLHKYHNPEGDDTDLQFDFTSCEGKIQEVIMAMVSVEKMFRSYRGSAAGEDSRVLVDKTVDAFLKKYFLQYRNYCSFTRENPGNDAYMYYTHIKEDEQYDDLTILGIKRK